MRATFGAVRSAPATFSYLGLLAATSAVLATTSDRLHDRILLAVSTNLHQLGRAPLRVLVASAFWLGDSSELLTWAALILVVLLPVERRLGWRRTTLVFAAGHVGATLLIAAGIEIGLRFGAVDPAIRYARDVGASYGFFAVAALAVYLIAPRLRPFYLALLGGAIVFGLASAGSFSDYGHLTAVAIGLACYPVVGPEARTGSGRAAQREDALAGQASAFRVRPFANGRTRGRRA